jgi:receptor protein-tyrosine kinase
MSRVHDALRRAEKTGAQNPPVVRPDAPAPTDRLPQPNSLATPPIETRAPAYAPPAVQGFSAADLTSADLSGLLELVEEVPFRIAADSLLIDASRPHEAPMEEFRTLRTRLNHMQSLQPIHTVVVTSASPAEGKSFTASIWLWPRRTSRATLPCWRISISPSHRPHTLFGIDRGPGITDYLLGKAPLHKVIKKIAGTNLYVAGRRGSDKPLELLNLREVKHLLDRLPSLFQWVIMDSPPLLFAADANLLGTMSDGILMVVRIGHTTIDSVTRATQSLCNNNVLGVVVNGARRGELYSKYTYYHSYYTPKEEGDRQLAEVDQQEVTFEVTDKTLDFLG